MRVPMMSFVSCSPASFFHAGGLGVRRRGDQRCSKEHSHETSE
jgi:hypothetical protein